MHSQLGPIVFMGLKGFTSLSSSREANYAEHALIENKPKLQRVGDVLEVIEGVMFFDVSFCNPSEEIAQLDTARRRGYILPLIMGDGRFLGEFVIKSVKVTVVHSSDDGRTLQAEVSVSLLEYFDADRLVQVNVTRIKLGFANPDNNPATFTPEPNALGQSPAGEAMQGVVNANAATSTAAETMTEIGFQEELYRPKAEDVINNMEKTADELVKVAAIINADPVSDIYARTRDLDDRISLLQILCSDVVTECEALISDIDSNNTVGVAEKIVSLTAKGVEAARQSSQLVSSASSLTGLLVTI